MGWGCGGSKEDGEGDGRVGCLGSEVASLTVSPCERDLWGGRRRSGWWMLSGEDEGEMALVEAREGERRGARDGEDCCCRRRQ